MIKRILKIAQVELSDLMRKSNFFENYVSSDKANNFQEQSEYEDTFSPSDPSAKYYANLEIPVGSNQTIIKNAWKKQLKKYHPDLHCSDPEKKMIAENLTRQLNEAYRILNSEFLKNNRR
jgi:DnaJ-domain-containing protein 1